MTTAEILSQLEPATKTRDGWQACCPAHKDKTPSLTIATGDDGRTLLYCQAGCKTEAVCAALGLTLADLFADIPQRKGARKAVAWYPYHDAEGELRFEVVRYEPKNFKQRRPDGKGGWIWDTKGIEKVIFRLPEVLAAINAGKRIYVTEGEKDALVMVKHGFEATSHPGGADKTASKWLDSYTATLKGAVVVIIRDKDGADKDFVGQKHAAAVAGKLHGKAGRVRVIECPDVDGKPVKDAADFFAAGGQAADLDAIAEAAPEFEPPDTAPDDGPQAALPETAPDFAVVSLDSRENFGLHAR